MLTVQWTVLSWFRLDQVARTKLYRIFIVSVISVTHLMTPIIHRFRIIYFFAKSIYQFWRCPVYFLQRTKSVIHNTQKVYWVLSLPETIQENLTFWAKALRLTSRRRAFAWSAEFSFIVLGGKKTYTFRVLLNALATLAKLLRLSVNTFACCSSCYKRQSTFFTINNRRPLSRFPYLAHAKLATIDLISELWLVNKQESKKSSYDLCNYETTALPRNNLSKTASGPQAISVRFASAGARGCVQLASFPRLLCVRLASAGTRGRWSLRPLRGFLSPIFGWANSKL